ncbi:phenylalanine--tRNA ligase subunit beta [Yinghuangia seranimata]|uniref:phenylalanine--tRNA ligase subunit beta n=1 Tax=Yinghuangia seranimata TaxID=408067 RepID=UPI00248BFA82|nr:phenylalanine--tRNA ligase subunit beta [Yinghuangia seranimata]MDI2126679.1 phenylalanine--tRNA ligase subunit beta [Yinghuangia seranimata]
MRVPLSWLREYVDLPAVESGRDVAAELIGLGLEVETVERLGADLKGPLVVGQVLEIEELTGFKKPIRFCLVDVGDANGTGEPQKIVCGATNFDVDDKVVVILPGGVLPGGFHIGARKTYGRDSQGMICSARELGMGDDHDGIIVLPIECEVGSDAIELLGLVDEVLDIAVTPDRGYCLSLRGVAREAAIGYGIPLRDPALLDVPTANSYGYPVAVEDPEGCRRFVARTVVGVDPEAKSPLWLQRRVQKAGMRPISLAVDVTNYVMLELGQPLHAYDRNALQGTITVRRAHEGEKLTTLDGANRVLDPEDLLITDDSGPIGLAGVMGGATTEIGPETRDIVIEAANFDPVAIARTARRHKLGSEASRRFERGVDPEAARAAAQRAVDLLVLLGGEGAVAEAGVTEVDAPREPVRIAITADHPARVAGVPYSPETVAQRLQEVGCTVEGIDALTVTPPTWRPDLTDPNDLAEEVIRLEGYDNVPSVLPQVPAGRGLTPAQRLRRRIGRALAGAGYVEVQNYPFVGDAVFDAFGLDASDPRRATVKLVNPISDEEPGLRTTLLPGLLATLRRNIGRGNTDVALFEAGLVFLPKTERPVAPRLPVDRRPTEAELDSLAAALPDQPYRVAAVLAGDREPAGWWGGGRAETWADAVEAARTVGRAVGVELEVRAAQFAPWHPGRCAELLVGDTVVGHAGELHPRVVKALQLPERTSAMQVDVTRLTAALDEQGGEKLATAGRIASFPVATQDVALVVDESVPAAKVEAALREGAGELLESLGLFDVFTGEQVGEGKKSLAYALRFRADDRTLTVEEATAARDAAVALAADRTGATLRGA